jgi:serine/threonine-protein kinase RsbW
MQIILIEGFMNVVKYAHYNLPSNTPINLLVNLFENLIEIRIWDYGLNFDLDKKFREELETSLNNPIKYKNNRGLLLMNCLSDKLIYVREEETRNCLIMQKYIAKNMNLQNQI